MKPPSTLQEYLSKNNDWTVANYQDLETINEAYREFGVDAKEIDQFESYWNK